jgi:Fe-S-cluster containining protein
MCGRCCHEVPGSEEDPTFKRIPVYPEEADRLEALAEARGIPLRLVEDVVFPDTLNEKILVLTWRIMLDNPEGVCPFHDEGTGCTIHPDRPLACQAYPLAIRAVDAFNSEVDIEPTCTFVQEHWDELRGISIEDLRDAFDVEYLNAMAMLARKKRAAMALRGAEATGKMAIARQFTREQLDQWLRDWDREVLPDD